MRDAVMILLPLVAGSIAGAMLNQWFRKRGDDTDASYEVFKNRAAGIQSLLLSLAIVFGGAWTFYTFVMRDVLKLFEEAEINIEITAREEDLPKGEVCVAALVKVTNSGKRNVFLDHRTLDGRDRAYSDERYPFSVTRALGTQRLEKGTLVESTLSSYRVLRSGQTVQYSFVATVPSPGIYVVRFEVPLPEPELQVHNRIAESVGAPTGRVGDISWVGLPSSTSMVESDVQFGGELD